MESLQRKTATTADARFAVQDAHDILLNKNAKFVNTFSTNVIVAIVGIPSVPKSYHLTMNTIVIYVDQCVRNVLVQNSSKFEQSIGQAGGCAQTTLNEFGQIQEIQYKTTPL